MLDLCTVGRPALACSPAMQAADPACCLTRLTSGSLAVILPIPLAADHRTTVSLSLRPVNRMAITCRQLLPCQAVHLSDHASATHVYLCSALSSEPYMLTASQHASLRHWEHWGSIWRQKFPHLNDFSEQCNCH